MEKLEEKIDEVKEEVVEEVVEEVKEEILEDSTEEENTKGKKDKKKKKEKKEKPAKEKKGFPKKLIAILLVFAILGGGGFFLYKNLPTIMKGKVESSEINVVVNYKKNLLFNKYNINVSFNGASCGTVAQGDTLENAFDMPYGDYVITFTDENDVNNTTSRIVTVTGSNEYTFTVKAGWKGLEISESVSPYVKEEVSDEVVEEENKEVADMDVAEEVTDETKDVKEEETTTEE